MIPISEKLLSILRGARAARDYAMADGCAYCRVVKGREAFRSFLVEASVSELGLQPSNELISAFSGVQDLDQFAGGAWFVNSKTGDFANTSTGLPLAA